MLRSEMEGYVETRGAKPFYHDKKKLAEELSAIKDGSMVLTNYMRNRMESEGYIVIVVHESDGNRGRPGSHIELTHKAERILGLAKAWATKRQKKEDAESRV